MASKSPDPTNIATDFECARDSGPWMACTRPSASWDLPLGDGPEAHVFSVRGVTSAAGPDPTPATWQWLHVADLLFAEGFEEPAPVPCVN